MERTIANFSNVHEGKRLFILASGQSLNDLDLSKLKNKLTMELNRSGLIYPDAKYHCAMDQRLFVQYKELMSRPPTLFTLENCPWGIPLKLLGSEGFSQDLTKGIYSGYTISYFALQLAIYMGFEEIIYLGLDLCHTSGHTHFFGTDYCSKNHEQTEFPKMIKIITYASKVLADKKCKVFNCSPVSTLQAFPKISYDEAVKR